MPLYEFICPEHGVFEAEFSFTEYDGLDRDEQCNALAPCTAERCECVATRRLQLFGSISTSDDPSFGSRRGEHRNREMQGFDENKHGWVERPKHNKSDWEYA